MTRPTLEANREAHRRWYYSHLEEARRRQRGKMKGKPRYTSRASKIAWEQANQEKVKAHRVLNGAVRRGKIIRPSHCEECGMDPGVNRAGAALIHGHHEDYTKPLVVIWLCVDCHRYRDRLEVQDALVVAT